MSHAEPVHAITAAGRPVVLDDDGSWRYTDTPAVAAPPADAERIGAWTVDLALSAVDSACRGADR